MAIGNAVQRGSFVYVYNEANRQLCTVPAGNGPEDGLKGYTSSRVNVRRGSFIYSYDETGRQVGTAPARLRGISSCIGCEAIQPKFTAWASRPMAHGR